LKFDLCFPQDPAVIGLWITLRTLAMSIGLVGEGKLAGDVSTTRNDHCQSYGRAPDLLSMMCVGVEISFDFDPDHTNAPVIDPPPPPPAATPYET